MAGLGRALVDRRDVTAARESEQQQPEGSVLSSDALVVIELLAVIRKLGETLTQDRAAITQLCVTDREPAQLLMRNFPVPGAHRLIVRRPGAGATYTLVQNVPTLLVEANENRLGLLISGAPSAVYFFLYASDLPPDSVNNVPASGVPQMLLTESTTLWDGRLGNLLWCGSVWALDPQGGSTVSVWEV